jgi:hypothetical protein
MCSIRPADAQAGSDRVVASGCPGSASMNPLRSATHRQPEALYVGPVVFAQINNHH